METSRGALRDKVVAVHVQNNFDVGSKWMERTTLPPTCLIDLIVLRVDSIIKTRTEGMSFKIR